MKYELLHLISPRIQLLKYAISFEPSFEVALISLKTKISSFSALKIFFLKVFRYKNCLKVCSIEKKILVGSFSIFELKSSCLMHDGCFCSPPCVFCPIVN